MKAIFYRITQESSNNVGFFKRTDKGSIENPVNYLAIKEFVAWKSKKL
jgi:hypothetical protein